MSTPAIEVALARWVRENTDHLSHVGAWLKSIRVGLKYWQETVEIKEGFTFGGHTPKRVGRHKVTRFRSVAEDYFFEISDPGIRRLYLGAMMVVRDWEKSPRDTEAVVERALVIHWLVTNPGSDPSVVGAANTSFPRTEKETIPESAGLILPSFGPDEQAEQARNCREQVGRYLKHNPTKGLWQQIIDEACRAVECLAVHVPKAATDEEMRRSQGSNYRGIEDTVDRLADAVDALKEETDTRRIHHRPPGVPATTFGQPSPDDSHGNPKLEDSTDQGMTMIELAGEVGKCEGTIRNAADAAKVARPKRGGRGHCFSPSEIKSIAQARIKNAHQGEAEAWNRILARHGDPPCEFRALQN